MLTDEQKKMRMAGCGGSEVGAILGVNPFAGPIDVYASKVEGREIADNPHMERGRFFERPTADWRVYRHGGALADVGTIQSHRHPLVICTPDFIVKDHLGELDLSIKSPGPFSARADWGEDGSDVVPYYALVQLQYELIVLKEMRGIDRGEVAAVVDGELRCYPMRADPELQGMLVEAVEKFWADYIIPRRPPPVDGSDSYAEYLHRRFPVSQGEMLPGTAAAEQWANAYLEARGAEKSAKALKSAAKNQLVALIGHADGVSGEDWKATYKLSKGKATVDWEAVCMEAEVPASVVARHTGRKPHRTILVTRNGEVSDE